MQGPLPFTKATIAKCAERLRDRRAAVVERLDTLGEKLADWEEARNQVEDDATLGDERAMHEEEIRVYVRAKYGDRVMIRAIYWTGSRAVGVNKNNADWDWMVIADNFETPLVGNVESYLSMSSLQLVDLSFCETDRWLHLVRAATLWAIPYCYFDRAKYCLYVDSEFGAREQAALATHNAPRFRLKEATIENVKANLGVAMTEWQQGSVRKCKKRVVYVIRHLDYVCQVCEAGAVVSDGNRVINALRTIWLETNFGSWSAFKNAWTPVVEELRQRLREGAASYKRWESGREDHGPLLVQDWINHHGLEKLYWMLAVNKTPVSNHEGVWLLQNTPESPNSSKVAQWCNLAVVNGIGGKNHCRLVAIGIPTMPTLMRTNLMLGPSHRVAMEKSDLLLGVARESCLVSLYVSGSSALVWHDGTSWVCSPENGPVLSWMGQHHSELLNRSDWCFCVRITAPEGFVRLAFRHTVDPVLLTAFDTHSWHETDVMDASMLHSWTSPHELWELWDRASRLPPEEFRGYVVSFKEHSNSYYCTRVLLENPSISALRGLRDADFASRTKNANRVGGVVFATGNRATRSHLSHNDDVLIRRALCFLPTFIDCHNEHESHQFVLPDTLDVVENHRALMVIRSYVAWLRTSVDNAFSPFRDASLAECSDAFKKSPFSSFLFLLKRQRFSSMHALMDGWKDRARLHLCIADHFLECCRKGALEGSLWELPKLSQTKEN